MSIKRKIGWILLIILFLIFNYIIFNNLGLKGGLMYYGALALFCGAVSLFVWLFNED